MSDNNVVAARLQDQLYLGGYVGPMKWVVARGKLLKRAGRMLIWI